MANEELGLEVAVEGFRRFMDQMGDMDKAIDRTGQQWGGMGRLTDVATVALGNLAARGIEIVTEALYRMGEAAVAALAQSVGLAADFEEQIALLTVATKDSNVTMADWHDVAIQIGADTALVGVSATTAAEGIMILSKAGLSTNETFGDMQGYMAGTTELSGALRASIDLAAASELEFADAAELATIVLSTWGSTLETEAERAEFVNQAMNNIVQSADASTASVGDLAAAYQNIGPVAASFGVTVEQVNAMLGILSTRGIRGSEAGTALKSMFTNLNRPTDAVKDSLRALNVELFDGEGNMRAWPDILADLEQALFGVSEVTVMVGGRTAEQNAQLATAQEEMTRLRGIYDRATQSLADYNAGLKGVNLSDEALNKKKEEQMVIMANAQAQMAALSGGVAELEAITGTATTATRQLTEEERLFHIQTLAGTYGMNALNALLAEGAEGYEAMTAATAEAATIQEISAARINTYKGQLEALDGVLETVKITVGEKFLPVLTELATRFATFAEENGPALAAFFEGVGQWLGETLPPLFDRLVQFLTSDVPAGIETASGFWANVLQPALQTAWAFIQEQVLPILATLANWLQMALPLAIQVLADFWSTYLLPVLLAYQKEWESKIQPALAELWKWLQQVIPPAIQALANFWTGTLQPALAIVAGFVTGTLIPLLGTLVSWLITNIPTAIQALANFWNNVLLPALNAVWNFVNNSVIPIFNSVVSFFDGPVTGSTSALADLWTNYLRPALAAVWEYINNHLFPLFRAIANFIKLGLGVAVTVLAGIFENTMQPALEGQWKIFNEKILPVLKQVWEFIKDKVGPIVRQFADNELAKLQGALDLVGRALDSVSGFIDGLASKLSGLELPAWMQPDSPPPLYWALQDIGDAMERLHGKELPRLRVGLDIPAPTGLLSMARPIDTAGGGIVNSTVSSTVENNFSLTTQSMTPQGGLALEFRFMQMASR